MKWITRVPERIKEAKNLVLSTQELEEIEPGYFVREVSSNYGGINQRWLVVSSQHAKERETKTLKKRVAKELAAKQMELNKFCTQDFDCKEDAKKSLERWAKNFKYHNVEEMEIISKNHKKGRGRPKADTVLKKNLSH